MIASVEMQVVSQSNSHYKAKDDLINYFQSSIVPTYMKVIIRVFVFAVIFRLVAKPLAVFKTITRTSLHACDDSNQ